MRRFVIVLALAFVVTACAQIKRGQAPFINPPSLMRGARCQYPSFDPKTRTFEIRLEGVFDEVRQATISKTADRSEWVIQFTDQYHCSLSFWIMGSEMDKPLTIGDISAY